MYNFYFSSDTPDINKTVCVDGFFPCALHLSHWPGNSTPAALKADTSTEIIFNLLEHPLKDKYLEGIDYVANNHYDVDGVLAAYSLMFPEAALKMKDRLIAIARTGDFSEYHDEDSFKSTVILENLYDEKFSPFTGEFSSLNFQQKTAFVYRKAFELIPGIVENPDMYESIWQQEFSQFMEGDSSFEKRESVFSNYDDCGLSVIESVYNLHPCVINKWSRHSTVLVVQKAGKEYFYKLFYKSIEWFDTGKPKITLKPGFESLAQELNLIDTKKLGSWIVSGTSPVDDYAYCLQFVNSSNTAAASELKVFEVENMVMDLLISYI